MADDGELLRRYATTGSEEAFAALVRRHVDLVYSAALRRMGDPHAAQDVVQLVFASLARQATRLRGRPELLSWLHTAVHYTAAKIRRAEFRRGERQMKALDLSQLYSSDRDPDWSRFRLVLDDALQDLGEKDRQAILVRFFEDKTFGEMAEPLAMTEDGARKRVERAMDKLRTALARRGVTSTAAAVAAALSQPLVAAPPGLATTATAQALTAVKLAGIVGHTLSMTTLNKSLIAAAVAVALGVAVYERQQATRLQSQVLDLQESVAASRSREQQARRDRNAAEAALAVSESIVPMGAKAGSLEMPPINPQEKMVAWLDKLEVSIPELRFLTAEDWAQLSKQAPLDTESQARAALRGLRIAAKGHLGSLIQQALQAYAAATGGQIPTDMTQLEPYFPAPVGPDILARYTLVGAGAIAPAGGGPGPGRSGPEQRTIIAEKPESIVDPEYDALASFSMAGTDIRVVGRTMDAFRAGLQSFSEANGGEVPNSVEQLLPHITSQVNPELLQQIFYDIITSRPAGQGAGG